MTCHDPVGYLTYDIDKNVCRVFVFSYSLNCNSCICIFIHEPITSGAYQCRRREIKKRNLFSYFQHLFVRVHICARISNRYKKFFFFSLHKVLFFYVEITTCSYWLLNCYKKASHSHLPRIRFPGTSASCSHCKSYFSNLSAADSRPAHSSSRNGWLRNVGPFSWSDVR